MIAHGAACSLIQLLRTQHCVTSHVKASPAYNALVSNVDDTDDGAERGQREFSSYSHRVRQLKIPFNHWDLLGGPVVKNLPYNAGDMGSIPGQEIKIPHATEQLTPPATARESTHHNPRSHVPQLRPDAAKLIN